MSDYATRESKSKRKLIEQKGGKRSCDSAINLAGPSKMIKPADPELFPYATTTCESKELEDVLHHTRRLTVCDEYSSTHIGHKIEGEKSVRKTALRGYGELKIHVDDWMSIDGETNLSLRDMDDKILQEIITILAPLCKAVEHISIDFNRVSLGLFTRIPMPMKSVLIVCIKSMYCHETLKKTLLEVSKLFPKVESLDLEVKGLHYPSSSLRKQISTDSLFLDISTSCPNVVSLLLSGFGRYLSSKSGKDVTSCNLPHLTNIHLEPFKRTDRFQFETLMNVLHVVHMKSPHLELVKAERVQLGGIDLDSVQWSRTSSGCELQLKGASAVVHMAGLMHLVSNELEGVTVLTFDRCDVDFPQSISHPGQSTVKESSLRELKFLNVECPLSQSDIHKVADMYPHVKVIVEHDHQASHKDSKQGTRMPYKQERKTFPSSPPSPTSSIVPDEVNVKPIKMECCKRVGVEGGKLQLDSFGIELEIPPGAIDSEAPRDISLRVLTDTSNIGNSKNEMSVCFGVQCLAPDDLVLKLPVTYTIPHCAIPTPYSGVKAVLYTGEGEYTPDAVVKERIVLSMSGIPSCIIRKDVLELKMNHFSWTIIEFFRNHWYSREKKMCCRPFKEKNLALNTPIIIRAHLYEDLQGKGELVKFQEGEQKFIPAHPEQQVLIQAAEGDLEMTCYVKTTIIGGPAVVSIDKLMSGTRICEPFLLDSTDQPDHVAVSLKVGQNKRLQVNLLFPLDFSAPHRKVKGSSEDQEQLQGASGSQTLQTSHRSKEEIMENIPGRQEDFDEKLTTVAQKVARRDEINKLGKTLGFEPEDIERHVDTNMKNSDVSYMGTLSMLRRWRNKQTKATECKALKDVLKKAGQIHLADELFGT